MEMPGRHTVPKVTLENPANTSAERKKAVIVYVLPQTMNTYQVMHLPGLGQRALSN
jgi:hypothetical protein